MSTPDNTDTLEQKVNTLASQLVKDDDGKLSLPDGVEADEMLLFAAIQETRRRETQGSYTKAQQRIRQLETENNELAANWEQDLVQSLPVKEQTRLDELKSSDPDAWREELNKLEIKAKEDFTTKRGQISQKAQAQTELEQRQETLEAFNKANPEFTITDEVIENDIPPRLTKKLETGEITFAQFLEDAKKYVTTPKAIQQPPKPPEEPNFAGARGSHVPAKGNLEGQSSLDYSKEVY